MKPLACLVPFLVAVTGCATAIDPPSASLGRGVSTASVLGGGRNIMRSPEGALITAFVQAEPGSSHLYFAGSRDNGRNWYRVASPNVGRSDPGTTDSEYPAIDSNVDGAYLAYVERSGNQAVGHVLFSPQPFAQPASFAQSAPLTPQGRAVRYSFIAATRVGWGDRPEGLPSSVAYGWVDDGSGEIYVGFSSDGRTFPAARVVHRDPSASSGPAVGVHGNYILLMYLSRDARFAPAELAGRGAAGEYQVWMESRDGGQTWSAPTGLFGPRLADYPRVPAGTVDASGRLARQDVIAAGGSPGVSDHSQLLVWSANDPGNEIVFVMSSLQPVTAQGEPVAGSAGNGIGVVSFKRLAPGGEWTHVVANRGLLMNAGARLSPSEAAAFAAPGTRGTMHQYSALPLTPVRAVTYMEVQDGNAARHRVVVVVSTDTGKNFNRYVEFGPEELARLGVRGLTGTPVVDVSQCLYADRDGNVYQDVLLLDGGSERTLYQLSLPLGVNVRQMQVANR